MCKYSLDIILYTSFETIWWDIFESEVAVLTEYEEANLKFLKIWLSKPQCNLMKAFDSQWSKYPGEWGDP